MSSQEQQRPAAATAEHSRSRSPSSRLMIVVPHSQDKDNDDAQRFSPPLIRTSLLGVNRSLSPSLVVPSKRSSRSRSLCNNSRSSSSESLDEAQEKLANSQFAKMTHKEQLTALKNKRERNLLLKNKLLEKQHRLMKKVCRRCCSSSLYQKESFYSSRTRAL
jgi:hypothetical protein